MTTPSKRKGDRGEREVADLLAGLTGHPVRPKKGAGAKDDTGDLEGLPDCTAEVKNMASLADAVRIGLDQLTREQANNGTTHGVALIRRPKRRGHAAGDQWVACLTLDGFAQLLMTATKPTVSSADVIRGPAPR